MKKRFIFAALALGMATLNSCTQEDTTEVPVESRMKPASNMRELTEQLKAYDARFIRTEEMPVRLAKGVSFTKLDYAKIAIADVCGGIRGSRGGIAGTITGAITSSLAEASRRYSDKKYKIRPKDKPKKSPIATFDGKVYFPDSLGYFHNTLEYSMYVSDNNSHLRSMSTLLRAANDRMLSMSPNYRRAGGLSEEQISFIATDLERIKSVDGSLSYKDYFGKLKEIYPENADIIDFCAEYVYTMLYANVDADDYTKEVLYMLKKSNVDISNSDIAYRGIQIAFASIQYSESMTYTSINAE